MNTISFDKQVLLNHCDKMLEEYSKCHKEYIERLKRSTGSLPDDHYSSIIIKLRYLRSYLVLISSENIELTWDDYKEFYDLRLREIVKDN